MDMIYNEKYKLNTFWLKMVAIITMLIDHTGAVLFSDNRIYRYIGRLAFPLFCFMIVEGYFHTRDVKKYAGRLFLFALISEIPFDMAFHNMTFYFDYQNVFFTLLIGLIIIYVVDILKKQGRPDIWQYMVFIVGASIAELLKTDYGAFGVLIIYTFYWLRDSQIIKCITVAVLIILYSVLNKINGGTMIEAYAALSLILVYFYNGKKGPSLKYIFYVFYPAHLLILHWIMIHIYNI